VNRFSQENSARLLELLGQEMEQLNRMHELTEKQAELLIADDIDDFHKSLDQRQGLIERIKGLHQESDVLMQSYVAFSSVDAGRVIEAIEKAVAERRRMIGECAALNEKNIITAKEKASSYLERLEKLSLNRRSIELYTPEVPNSPEIIDKKT